MSHIKINQDNVEKVYAILTEEQKKVFEGLLESLQSDHQQYSVLTGYAGTGKTFVISRIIESIDAKIAVTAPTNKAVKVLKDAQKFDNGEITYETIHKLLALKVAWKEPNDEGQGTPKLTLIKNMWAEPTVNDYDIIIVDEASMLDDEVFNMLDDEVNLNVKVIFLGDPAQIPPVNHFDSIPLHQQRRENWGMQLFQLKTIMRQQDGNTIIGAASSVRSHRFEDTINLYDRSVSVNLVVYPYSSQNAFETVMLQEFLSDDFKKDANYCKTIAWTNNVVNKYNSFIRRTLYNNEFLPSIVEGEKLIADKPIFDSGDILFTTSEEFTVTKYDIKHHRFRFIDPSKSKKHKNQEVLFGDESDEIGGEAVFKYYDATVRSNGKEVKIKILHEDDASRLKSVKRKLIRLAKNDKTLWKQYYKLYELFAHVKYNYAITAHKSQGSTYQNVFIIENDIFRNKRYIERNRILYTAMTRASEMLHILSPFI